ncbi:hypothetical protein M422DRAFT_70007 [Sphaerobolus stellatus SS14]|uniref:Uncharacterized protein n=1 Tax=Sphaerobolus stellatus (strain SS14) TaxID=990650 RepID=A0A0C9VC62_SPHS4|nr:hypothetical protein M422DRAFT_70007 [Sphaerobolus stellatus SS14]
MKSPINLASLAVFAATVSAQSPVSLVAPALFAPVTAGVPFIISLKATILPNSFHEPLNFYIGQQPFPSNSTNGDVGPQLAVISTPTFAATSAGLFLNTSVVLNTLGETEISVVEFFVGGPSLNARVPGATLFQTVVTVG